MLRQTALVILAATCAAPSWADEDKGDGDRHQVSIRVATGSGEPIHAALGRELPSGVALPLYCISATESLPERIPAYLTQQGYVRSTGVPGSLEASLPCNVGLVLAEQLLLSIRAERPEVVMTVEPATILTRLRSAEPRLVEASTGDRVEDVSARLVMPWVPRLLRVDEGRCLIPAVPPCRGRIDISGGRYAMAAVSLETALQEETIRLVPATTIRGRALLEGEDARTSIRLSYFPRNGGFLPPRLDMWPYVTAAADGSFVIRGSYPDPVVVAMAKGHAVSATVVDSSSARELSIRMRRGSPVRVTTSRKGLRTPRFTVRDENGVPGYGGTVCEGTDAGLRLAEGAYVLEYQSPGEAWTKKPFAVREGGGTVVSIP